MNTKCEITAVEKYKYTSAEAKSYVFLSDGKIKHKDEDDGKAFTLDELSAKVDALYASTPPDQAPSLEWVRLETLLADLRGLLE